MTVSIGSYDDLQPDPPQPIDRDPIVACPECGEKYYYNEYWADRYVHGKGWDPRTVYWICDDCLDRMYGWYEQRVTERQHRTLEEWSE